MCRQREVLIQKVEEFNKTLSHLNNELARVNTASYKEEKEYERLKEKTQQMGAKFYQKKEEFQIEDSNRIYNKPFEKEFVEETIKIC